MSRVVENLSHLHQQIDRACAASGRPDGAVQLLCVSKTKSADLVREAYDAGERHFGESYISEAVDKIAFLKAEGLAGIIWHFIGPIQSNKTRLIAENFDIVESLDRLKIARRLDEQRPENLPPLQVLIEVNLSAEAQKSGCPWEEAPALAAEIQKLPHLELKGLMGVATDTDDTEVIRAEFTRLQKLRDTLATPGAPLAVLSMGMTADLDVAIACGSTEVRIGTAIFGAREYPHHPA